MSSQVYEGFFRRYAEEEVAQQSRELFMNAVAADSIHGKLSEDGADPRHFTRTKKGNGAGSGYCCSKDILRNIPGYL